MLKWFKLSKNIHNHFYLSKEFLKEANGVFETTNTLSNAKEMKNNEATTSKNLYCSKTSSYLEEYNTKAHKNPHPYSTSTLEPLLL